MITVTRATEADFASVTQAEQPLSFNYEFVDRLSRATGYPNLSLLLRHEEKRFLLPVLRRRAFGVIPLDFSLPFGMYASLYPEPPDPQSYAELLRAAKRHLGAGLVVHNAAHAGEPIPGLFRASDQSTHWLYTRDTSYDELFKKTFDAKLRNQIRKGERSNLEVVADNSLASIRRFYSLYLLSNERWGKSPKYSLSFFEAFAGAPFFALKVALFESQPIAGIVVLKFRDNHFYWFGSLDKAHGSRCPNHLLLSLAIREAIDAKVRFLDFGASGKLESVRKFKESFGAELRPFFSYFLGNPLVGRVLRSRMQQ